ncbi:MAG TPA: hypothetical protein VHM29_02635, partial [Acidimicrobiia bacterium]|nr:hypothetical protein [Acidimicrobiia bacterium]
EVHKATFFADRRHDLSGLRKAANWGARACCLPSRTHARALHQLDLRVLRQSHSLCSAEANASVDPRRRV